MAATLGGSRPSVNQFLRRRLLGDLVPPRKLPIRPREMAGVAVGVVLQIVLVLRLRLPERALRNNLGDNLPRPEAGGLDVGDRVLRNPLLPVAGVEDRPTIARTDV